MPRDTATTPSIRPVRVQIDPALLAHAQRTLGTTSDRETVSRALEEVVARARVAAGLRRLGGKRRLQVPPDLR
jgi:Arc/MetJ family transcription regulator